YRKDNQIVFEEEDGVHVLPEESPVSMNYFCFAPGFISLCEKLFNEFIVTKGGELKSEFFIPFAANYFIEQKLGVLKVLPTSSQWFGVT
ncbi:hypothetical protein ABTB01_19635, partial [Acinetobacter baumannii]